MGTGSAAAHTEVLRSSPAPGEQVSGTVDTVELTFLDPVQPGAQIVVFDELGEPVDGLGATELSDDRITARVRFAPLEVAGGYVVEYAYAAGDGDRQRQTFRFTYRPPAEPAPEEQDAIDPLRLAAAGVVGAVLVGAVAVSLRRRRN